MASHTRGLLRNLRASLEALRLFTSPGAWSELFFIRPYKAFKRCLTEKLAFKGLLRNFHDMYCFC